MAAGAQVLASYIHYTHIHIICNYNSQCMMLRERRGVHKVGDVIRHIVPAPASCSPARRTSQSDTSPPRQGCPFPLCISYNGIVCPNNFNGSRQRISFARRLEKKFSRERIYIYRYTRRGIAQLFQALHSRLFFYFILSQNLLCLSVYFTYNFAASFFIISLFFFPLL